MNIFQLMKSTNNNEVIFFEEPLVNLKMIIAINDTTLGPALSNIRIEKDVENSLTNTLKLAFYNTIRSALLHKDFGGAGISIIDDGYVEKNEYFYRTLGIIINKLAGRIYLLKSPGFTIKEIQDIQRETSFVLGNNENYSSNGLSPRDSITKGILHGLKALAYRFLNQNTLSGLSFAIQGVGQIGSKIVEELLKIPNTSIIITDTIYDKIKIIKDKSPNIKIVKSNEIYSQKCDIFLNCAKDNLLNNENLSELKCRILTGSVNEMLENPELEQNINKNIIYIPGFIINGGDIIAAYNEFKNKSIETLEKDLEQIYNLVLDIIDRAETLKTSLTQCAVDQANQYIENIAKIKRLK